jgi:hypothetical protein
MNGFKHSWAKTDLSKNLSGDYHVAEFREGLVETARWLLQISARTQRSE